MSEACEDALPERGRCGTVVRAEARVTLFCFPHAGGGASAFRNWDSALAPHVAVRVLQLPGRESRFKEPAISNLSSALADLLLSMKRDLTTPFAFFGHSMGALLAFELAHVVRGEIGREPMRLFISACRAPHLEQVEPCSTLPQDEFVAAVVRRYGGIPAAILADKGFLAAILPAMRADFGILERYRAPERTPLACPISVFGGRDDKTVPLVALEAWREHTRGPYSLEMLAGDHFYLQTQRPLLAQRIQAVLENDRVGAGAAA